MAQQKSTPQGQYRTAWGYAGSAAIAFAVYVWVRYVTYVPAKSTDILLRLDLVLGTAFLLTSVVLFLRALRALRSKDKSV